MDLRRITIWICLRKCAWPPCLPRASPAIPLRFPRSAALAMATRLGAAALHIGPPDRIARGREARRPDGAGRVGRAQPCRHSPAIPAASTRGSSTPSKSTDVVDVLCNGRWLMRNRALQTVAEDEVMREAVDRARSIDSFLGSREVSVLQKLVAVGGAVEQESFEVQAKARLDSDSAGARGAGRPRADRHPPEPLSPTRPLLVVRLLRPGPPALSRRRVPRRQRLR